MIVSLLDGSVFTANLSLPTLEAIFWGRDF
jgi:hypothetical protein